MRRGVWTAIRRFSFTQVLLGASLFVLTACQTTPTSQVQSSPTFAAVYSGYFVWDSEREIGDAALQCMRLVLEKEEVLEDGRLRLTGVTRYITGPERDVNFVDAEVLYDPADGRFEMWERNATSDDFVTEGSFLGQILNNYRFIEGYWKGQGSSDSGRLTLQIGADAPCTLAQDA